MFMRRRAFFLAPLMFLLLLGGVSLMFSRGRTADAYEAGYLAGQMAALPDAAPGLTAPPAGSAYDSPHMGSGPTFLGGLLKLFFFLFLFGWLFRLMGFWGWRHRHSTPCGPRHHAPWGHHGPDGPREKSPDGLDDRQSYV